MKNAEWLRHSLVGLVAATALLLASGCQSTKEPPSAPATSAPAPSPAPVAVTPAPAPAAVTPPTPAPAAAPAAAVVPIRIKAGPSSSFKDAEGNDWVVDQGFADGETIERPDLEIENTKTPAIYRSERYSMTAFSYKLPNGKYVVKLHFAETFEGIGGPGERVFSFNVEGRDFNDFDVWVKAGGPRRAYIETVPVEVTDGKLDITFSPKVENPEINGIEILPGS